MLNICKSFFLVYFIPFYFGYNVVFSQVEKNRTVPSNLPPSKSSQSSPPVKATPISNNVSIQNTTPKANNTTLTPITHSNINVPAFSIKNFNQESIITRDDLHIKQVSDSSTIDYTAKKVTAKGYCLNRSLINSNPDLALAIATANARVNLKATIDHIEVYQNTKVSNLAQTNATGTSEIRTAVSGVLSNARQIDLKADENMVEVTFEAEIGGNNGLVEKVKPKGTIHSSIQFTEPELNELKNNLDNGTINKILIKLNNTQANNGKLFYQLQDSSNVSQFVSGANFINLTLNQLQNLENQPGIKIIDGELDALGKIKFKQPELEKLKNYVREIDASFSSNPNLSPILKSKLQKMWQDVKAHPEKVLIPIGNLILGIAGFQKLN